MVLRFIRRAARRLLRQPGITSLNVLGLALGLACCLLIGIYIQHETSYDRFHPDADRIVRVIQREADGGGMSTVGGAFSPILRTQIPQVERVAGIVRQPQTLTRVEAATGATATFEEPEFAAATPEFFDVFTGFPLLKGDPGTALTRPNQLVLTQSAATKYFGDADPMGRTLRLDDERQLTVTGVMADPPANSHLQFSMLASPSTILGGGGGTRTTFATGSYWYPGAWLYARLKPGADRSAAESQLRRLVAEGRRAEVAERFRVDLQPLTRIHLHSTGLQRSPSPPGNLGRVLVFGAIALFVLVIAGINFTNLSTARAADRAREVGVRKTLGASGQMLVRQFLGEALLVSGLAAGLALALTATALPLFEAVSGVTLAYGVFTNGPLLAGACLAAIGAGLGAGSYPALVLARFDPSRALRDLTSSGQSRSSRLRRGLVVFQFSLTVILVVGTAVAVQQLRYMQTARLGFDTEQVVVMEAGSDVETLLRELKRRPEVQNATTTNVVPGAAGDNGYRYEVNGKRPDDPEERIETHAISGNFFDVLDVEVLAGRTFSKERPADRGTPNAPDDTHPNPWWRDLPLVINKATADKFGWTPEEALGQTIRLYTIEGSLYWADQSGPVVGVVENYHARSLREAIPPVVFRPALARLPEGGTAYFATSFRDGNVIAKVAPGDAAQAMDALTATWASVNPDEGPPDASFLNDDLQQLYVAERRVGRIMGGFAGLAVLVACLGLVGLAAYTTQQRIKEIGIRKALGASVPGIIGLLSRDFLKLVALSVLLGSPVAYVLANEWLTQFAYRITPGVGIFAACTALVLSVAALSVAAQTFRAARADPARVLQSE